MLALLLNSATLGLGDSLQPCAGGDGLAVHDAPGGAGEVVLPGHPQLLLLEASWGSASVEPARPFLLFFGGQSAPLLAAIF
jgi:hypothetical protein